MFKVFNEGEEVGEYETLEEVRALVADLREDYRLDDLTWMGKYPQDYSADYKAGDGFDDYFRDVYTVAQPVDLEQFLW